MSNRRREVVRYQGKRRHATQDAMVLSLAVWDGDERVFALDVIVSGQVMTAVGRDLGQPSDETTLRAVALWAAREVEVHGVERYGQLTSEDPLAGELWADHRGVSQLAASDELPELTRGAVVHLYADPEVRATALLAPLDELSKRVMILRLGFDRGEPRTREEVAAEVGLSRDEVRRIEEEAMERLKRRGEEYPPPVSPPTS